MTLAKSAKKIIESIGKNNKPVYAVVAVACANGIFKPLTSLTDKKEKSETKNYAALREFLTEVVAIPTYVGCSRGAEKLASAFKNPTKAAKAKSNLSFIGVCTAAVFVIPALCSVIIKPMTDMIFHRGKKRKKGPARIDIISNPIEIDANKGPNRDFEGNINRPLHNYSMKVFTNNGGLKV